MKHLILTTVIGASLLCGAQAQEKAQVQALSPSPKQDSVIANKNAPEITFESEIIDYGTIEHNANGVREFKFKNTGKEPLIISNARGSCGCTVPTWPHEPIMPGESNVIQVKYSTDRVGHFTKTITLSSNAKTSTKTLTIQGDVLPDPTPPKVDVAPQVK